MFVFKSVEVFTCESVDLCFVGNCVCDLQTIKTADVQKQCITNFLFVSARRQMPYVWERLLFGQLWEIIVANHFDNRL